MIGNEPHLAATCCRSCAFSRCCHSGVRWPGRRRGSSSARAAFSRKRAANSGLTATRSSTQILDVAGGTADQLGGRRRVGVGQPDGDAVVGPVASTSMPSASVMPRLDGHRPGRVHAAAERRQHADPPVADLVAEPLDHDRAVVGHHAGGPRLVVQVGGEVAGGALVQRRRSERVPGVASRPPPGPARSGRPMPSPFQNGILPGTPGAGEPAPGRG